MDNVGYAALSRQSGLMREMAQVANNLANMSTTGFRREGTVFAEYIQDTGADDPSLSMGFAHVRHTSADQGALTRTAAPLDFAIEGEGFFLIQTADGQKLTRAGNFSLSPEGSLVTPQGHALLDGGGAPIQLPSGATDIALGNDGTLSVNDQPFAQIGLWSPADLRDLERRDGVMFEAPGGVVAIEEGRILQGFIERSNVSSVREIARMIEVQRHYELGQKLLDREDERIRSVIRTVTAR